MATQKDARKLRIKRGIRKKISGTSATPRLAVYKSNKEIYAQVIDDVKGVTLASFSSRALGKKEGAKIDQSKSVGVEIAKVAIKGGVSAVVFDRGGYNYHGRIKALAEGAREGGLKF